MRGGASLCARVRAPRSVKCALGDPPAATPHAYTCSVKRALGDSIILSEPELHTLRLTEATLFAVAVSDGITNALSDETIVNQVRACA